MIDTWRTPGRWCPGDVAAHGSPCSPAESVQREGVPCATPAKLLYCAMHPATLAVSVKPSTAAQRRPHADSKTLDTSSAPIQYSQLNCICHVFSLVSGREVGGSADHHITTPQAFSLSLCLHLLPQCCPPTACVLCVGVYLRGPGIACTSCLACEATVFYPSPLASLLSVSVSAPHRPVKFMRVRNGLWSM